MSKGQAKKLYLDVCALCRPFDDQSAMRIRLETDALYLILQNVQDGLYGIVVSPAHIKEIEGIEDASERFAVMTLLKRYGIATAYNESTTRARAEQLHALKFGVADAAHIAFAEETADFFISCDDRLLKQCRRHSIKLPALNPVEFCGTENLR
jgi:predicted nucleic acid-binding protein